MRRPPSAIDPADGASNPPMQRSVVVFPQPLGPSSEKNSPSITSNESGPIVTWGEYRLTSSRTASPTGRVPAATGGAARSAANASGSGTGTLAQHLLVPSREIRRAMLVHLLEVERHHVLEVVLLQGIVRHLRRQLRLLVG